MAESITQQRCVRCGRSWYPRSAQRPNRCPACNSPYWDRTRRSQIVEQITGIITQHPEWALEDARRVNAETGWTFDVRWGGGGGIYYSSDTDYTRVESAILSETELVRAWRMAQALR